MCFSASASFTASALLAGAGVATVSQVRHKSHAMFASIPFLFALQQFCEGMLWLTFSYPGLLALRLFAMYGFLGFAFFLWPLWIPLSLFFLEAHFIRKKLLLITFFLGVVFALISFFYLALFGTDALIKEQHVCYLIDVSSSAWLRASFLYLVATVLPFFISSIKLMRLFGTMLGLSYVFTYLAFYNALVSVWCFFAAVLSILILLIMKRLPVST